MRSLKNSNYFEWILALKWPLTCKKKVQMRGEKKIEEQEAFRL